SLPQTYHCKLGKFIFNVLCFFHPDLLTCFNGGECIYRELCNCSRFNATGPRCQTVYNTGAERDHICRTWGQYNFETFDGLYYYFSGKSTYALVRHTELDEQSFSIQVNNDPECHSSPYSCKRSISLFFSGDEEIKMSSEVTYKGFGVQLPYIIGNLHIQKLAGYFLVRHQYAFTLAWDGTSAVYIKMAPEYLGKTHGLCGNNNAVLQDDLETSYGKLTDDVTEFVESWQENPPQGTPNWDKSLLNEPPCLTQTHESLQRAYTLCNILLHPPFEQCHEYVSPLPFMASCTNDLCMSAVDNATWCRALTEYARACAQAGKPLHGWRMHFQQCVITCAEPLTYNECINCCPVSCHQQSQCIVSELPCIDGCYCPDGLIYENELCVKPMDCPCDYHGSLFEMGSVVYEECNNCTCTGGKWICTNLTCPAECSVSGDIHFMTFDGRKYTFQATCQYILAKSRTSGVFTISLQNAPCGQNQDGSCIQSISLILKQDPKRQVTLTQSGDVLVYDQYKINLPYADELFEIRKLSSLFLQVKTHIGLQILYDREGLRLYLQADGRWKDDTVGLCGTFNGNMEDDFLSPVGVTESTPELFGNTWKTSSACILVHDSSQMDPCDIHLQAASYAAEACSILTKELFAPCYPYLSPVPYFEQCRRDTCKCGQSCFCSALAHYAHHCRRFGVVIDFRGGVPDCALSCEDTKEYSICVSTCGRTCQALSVPETCSSDCVEGCACPSGMYLNSKTERCVQRNECPCYFQGIDYPPGENVMTSLGKCCPVGQVYINCSNPQVDPELSRERSCENQLLNLTFSAHLPCVSGCVCPLGLVKHGDVCLVADECPCSWKGKEYFPGDKVISSCHTCICQHGSFQCTFHPCPSMCTAYGDRHYRTFDGLTFDFVGTCKAYLVKGTSSTSFSVIIENINCFNTGIICRKNIFVNVGKSFLIFDDETGNPSLSSYIDELQKIQLWKAGFFTVVHFPDEHITILWDQRTTVHVQMGHQWQGKLTGLCGNFDLKTVNELRTPDNFELTNSQEFGNSWTAVECVDSSDIRNPCSLNPLREPFAKKECGILLSEAFEACHPVIDVTWFYSNCLTDTCGCNQGGDCECFCTSVSAYAHQCCQHGVAVDWRSPRVCPYDCEYFNKVLGKGPYKLVSYLDGEFVMAVKLVDGVVFPVREEDIVPGHAVSFMLTSGLYKPKAHDFNLVSFETAERPNYFLQLASNNTLALSKWEKREAFHNRSTFVIHKNTWVSGYSSFESFAKPGYFIHISASSVELLKYHHSEEFRLSTLFKLVDVKFKFLSHSACEWHYDACTSPCFKTCKDPLGKTCQAVPKVEGCIPACPLNMLLDEVTQRCVYFEDCISAAFMTVIIHKFQTTTYLCLISGIEPADDSPPLPASIRTPAVSHITSSTSWAVISEAVTSFPVPEAKDTETTLASKLQLTATTGKTAFSAVTFNTTAITLSSNISLQSTEMTSGRSTTAMSGTTKSNVSLSSPVDVSPLFPSTVSSETSTKIQPIISGFTELLRTTEPQAVTATHAVTTSTESEGKPISTLMFNGTPLILRTTAFPVKTKIMEIPEIATRTLPIKEAQVKPEELTTYTPSSFESIREKTTVYLPQFSTSPPLGVPSYTPPVNLTGTSEGTKISIGQSFSTVPNVILASVSPVITTLSLLKPVSSATTKAAIVLTKQSTKTTYSPTSTPPISLGKAITEPTIEMVQHLTGTAEVPFTTTLGLKTTTLKTQERSSETSLLSFTTLKKETPQTTPHVEHTSSSYFPPYSLHPKNECIKQVCLDGQLIQVNKLQNCPYNATQPSCGVLGFATQTNGDKCCPKWECACRCTIFSDLSIVTYDGNHLALFKEASYVVSQTQDETITIHVLDCRMVTNICHNSDSPSLCLAMLNLTYVSNQIIINRLSRKITVNSRFAWPTVRKYGYKVEDSGFKYAVETPTKIRIQWFHSTGVMIIEFNSTREPRALGLCGFCDRSLENDLMLPNRTFLIKSDAPSTFIDSWQVPDTLKYVGEDRHREANCSVMDCSECLRLVLNQTFSSCHPYVSPELFCNIWVQDTEYIQNPCISLAAYVAMCNKFNICIEWRSSDYCPFPCSENFSYQACIAACEVADSCQNNEVTSLDADSCSVLTEGCVCAGGTILHRAHTAVCIPEEKCACTDSSGAPHAVGEIWKTSLSGCCMQKCVDSETIIPVEYDCSAIHDLDCQRFAEVALLVPGDQTCCPQKICICNQSLCEPLIPECNGLEKLVTYYSEESCCPNYVCECDPAKCEPVEQMPSCQDDQTLIAARVESTCCISYICACGACSDQIPKCQEGEVLIVDTNTTERCCPTYQCICEIHRCPEFKCMLGMSLVEVWSPEKCCPFQTCGKMTDFHFSYEQFQNSTENICNCVKYKCGKDKVCLSNERGVLLPGQMVVEHSADGICHVSYCTNVIDPSTKYYRINTSSIDCTVKCKANQVYQPPKDLTTCCGSCKNLSCLHTFSNGTVSNFKPGTVWISNCIRYECTNTAIGPVLVSSSVGCPPFNETECVKVGGYVVPFLEGCCKTCKEDGKFCKKVTVRMTIRKNDCRSNTPVNIVSCDGKCPSASIYNYNINTYARFCKCCRELRLQRRTVQLYCTSNSTWVSYSIQEPTDCSCQWS
uniref:Otogelin n=1 Tax=Buteo japonicus TaxID=224669 RepID=A0A8C0AS39_9AVES